MQRAVIYLEATERKTDSRLDDIAWELAMIDRKATKLISVDRPQISVMNTVDDIWRMKEEYETLKCDVSNLQKEEQIMHNKLLIKAIEAQNILAAIKEKLNKNCKPRQS